MAAVSSGMVTVRFNDMLQAGCVKKVLDVPGLSRSYALHFDREIVDFVARADLDCCYGQQRRRTVSHAFVNWFV